MIQATRQIKKLSDSSLAMNSTVGLVLQFAGDLELLADNAQIEAARHREAGGVFTAVAEQTGRLAEDAQKALTDIQAAVLTNRQETAEVGRQMEQVATEVVASAHAVERRPRRLQRHHPHRARAARLRGSGAWRGHGPGGCGQRREHRHAADSSPSSARPPMACASPRRTPTLLRQTIDALRASIANLKVAEARAGARPRKPSEPPRRKDERHGLVAERSTAPPGDDRPAARPHPRPVAARVAELLLGQLRLHAKRVRALAAAFRRETRRLSAAVERGTRPHRRAPRRIASGQSSAALGRRGPGLRRPSLRMRGHGWQDGRRPRYPTSTSPDSERAGPPCKRSCTRPSRVRRPAHGGATGGRAPTTWRSSSASPGGQWPWSRCGLIIRQMRTIGRITAAISSRLDVFVQNQSAALQELLPGARPGVASGIVRAPSHRSRCLPKEPER